MGADDRHEELVRYLLGDVSEEDAQRLEAGYLEDDPRFLDLLAAEDELFFDYAQGALSDGDRRRFERRFLQDEEGRRRLARSRAVIGALGSPRARRPALWLGLPAAAVLLLAVWWALRSGPLDDPVRGVAGTWTPGPRVDPVVVLVPGGEVRVYLPQDAARLTLSLEPPQPRPNAEWRLELRAVESAVVWKGNPVPGGARTLKVEIPTRGLSEDEYLLTLSDRDEALAVYSFVLVRD